VALVGTYLAGKTSLLEALLAATGAIPRKGTVKDGSTVGDAAPEARARRMSAEITVAETTYLGEPWIFLDCPGSIELAQETANALMVADAAVVVCEPEPERALMIAPLLRRIEERHLPHMIFVNKIDHANVRIRDLMEALQAVSSRPLVLRQVPIRDGDAIKGYVDLISERAYRYKPGEASDLIGIPEAVKAEESAARDDMLEALADFDDKLLGQLLEDVTPPPAAIYDYLANDLRRDLIVPVMLGSAERDHGVRRLLKALRHEVPDVAASAARRGIAAEGDTLAEVFKIVHAHHAGKLCIARIWRGSVAEGASLAGERVGGVTRFTAASGAGRSQACGAGAVVGLARMSTPLVGDRLTPAGREAGGPAWTALQQPVYALAVQAVKKTDDVKLSGALAKVAEEDPGLHVEPNPLTGELLLWGQGDVQLQIALERLTRKHGFAVTSQPPRIPYKETIRRGTSHHYRHKRQTGGHGQFGDVYLAIAPLKRGQGNHFAEAVVGGAVPRQFIPAVEAGVKDALAKGPLGYPVVDVGVTLTDGQAHSVDSSDMAFRTAARQGMVEALPQCDPTLLEPILKVVITVPNPFTARAQRIITGRRGQILGFAAKPDWTGWDEVTAHLPQAEVRDLIVELRSLTMGVGSFAWAYDHDQELVGRAAEQVVAAADS